MVFNSVPCNGCTERFYACYDRCPKDARGEYGYKAWKDDLRKFRAAEREYKRKQREDWMHSEQRSASAEKFARSKK